MNLGGFWGEDRDLLEADVDRLNGSRSINTNVVGLDACVRTALAVRYYASGSNLATWRAETWAEATHRMIRTDPEPRSPAEHGQNSCASAQRNQTANTTDYVISYSGVYSISFGVYSISFGVHPILFCVYSKCREKVYSPCAQGVYFSRVRGFLRRRTKTCMRVFPDFGEIVSSIGFPTRPTRIVKSPACVQMIRWHGRSRCAS